MGGWHGTHPHRSFHCRAFNPDHIELAQGGHWHAVYALIDNGRAHVDDVDNVLRASVIGAPQPAVTGCLRRMASRASTSLRLRDNPRPSASSSGTARMSTP